MGEDNSTLVTKVALLERDVAELRSKLEASQAWIWVATFLGVAAFLLSLWDLTTITSILKGLNEGYGQ